MIWFIAFVIAFLPAYQIRFKIGFLPLTLLEIFILVLFIFWFFQKTKKLGFKNFFQDEWNQLKNWRWLIIGWLFFASLAIFISPDMRAAAGVWKAFFVQPILFFLVFIDLVKTEKEKRIVLFSLFFSVFYLSFGALWQKFFQGGVMSLEVWGEEKIWRATSLFPHPNFLGLYLGPIILLSFGYIWQIKKKILVVVSGLVLCLSVLAIILARSEGALLGLVAGLIFFGLLSSKIRKWTIVGIVILTIITMIFSPIRNYLFEKAFLRDLSGQLRLNIWQGALDMIRDQPIFGVGLNAYQKLAPQYQERYYHPQTKQLISVETHPYPHNLYLAVWLELGLAGLLIFIGLIINFFVLVFREIKKSPAQQFFWFGLGSAMIVLLVHGLVDTPYFKNDLSVLFWLIISLSNWKGG